MNLYFVVYIVVLVDNMGGIEVFVIFYFCFLVCYVNFCDMLK